MRDLRSVLPVETSTRIAVGSFLCGLVAALFLVFVLPALAGPGIDPPADGPGVEDDAVEPDGVRSSPTFAPSSAATPPQIPDEAGAQQ